MSNQSAGMQPPASEAELNRQAYRKLLDELYARRKAARVGGPESARKKHRERGKLLARERIDVLIDPGSPFLELAEFAGEGLYEGVPPGAGMITGVGTISGRPCMIIANDATVKGGTYFGMTCRKHVRAQRFAWENRLPCVTLVDSGGAFLPDQANIFPDEGLFGSIFHNQVGMSADGIPQIAVVLGACTAGGAYIPALCDEVVIVREQGFMYLGGPQLVQAATGEQTDAEALGGAMMHSRVSGVTDHLAENDAHALAITRSIIAELPALAPSRWKQSAPALAQHPAERIYEIVSRDARKPTDTRAILKCLLDGGELQEFKAEYGNTLITGFGRMNGHQVGVLANAGVLFTEVCAESDAFHQSVLSARRAAAVSRRCLRVHGGS